MLSVIVPVYNVKKYLDECINSILNQTYTDFELILVDDGSTDGSSEICDKYLTDTKVKVIHKENGGHSSARQAGFLESSGDYCCFVDSDDLIASDFLMTFAKLIENYRPDVIESGYERFSNTYKVKVSSFNEGLYKDADLSELKKKLIFNEKQKGLNCGVVFYSLCTKCIKRSLLEQFMFSVDKDLVMGEDMAVTMPLVASCQSIYIINYCGYKYRDNPTSIVNTFREQDFQNCKKLVKFLDLKLPKHKSQISAYFSGFIKNYVVLAGKAKTTYKEFKALIRENIQKEDFKRMSETKIKGDLFKNKVCKALIRLRLWRCIWLYCKLWYDRG